MHLIPSSDCNCGAAFESPKHQFLQCPLYAGIREELITNVNVVTDCNIILILFGDQNQDYEKNYLIFKSVHKYIKSSKRFDS